MKDNLKSVKRIFLSLFLCIAVVLTLPGMVHAQEQPFWTYASKCIFYENEIGGISRVCSNSADKNDPFIHVEDFDSAFVVQAKYEIPKELPLFGTFFVGSDYNYMVFGQENLNDDNNVEVIRVVKYTKNWERVGHASVLGANTTVPFASGNCSCAEANGMLYIHTCHKMYKTSDGLNHQANMTLVIRESDMVLTDKNANISNISTGYVSHSFDQYIITDQEGNVVTLDLGDAYPRAIVLTRYNGKAGSEKLGSVSNAIIHQISGKIGDNNTGVMLGGLVETDTGYITLYTSRSSSSNHPAYMAFINKNDLSVRTMQLSAPETIASTPIIVPVGTSGGYILWNNAAEGVVYYAQYFSDGSLGEFYAASTHVTKHSRPIYYNGKLVWGVNMGELAEGHSFSDRVNKRVEFYLLDQTGVETITIPII